MDTDIQFGDLEESVPEVRMRPDQNKHFAVVPCQTPLSDELPIYVDVDVMRDMEEHAQTNTSVELGGVMLGGQYEDDEGNPFVLVTDSLRAEHYEATKGSFKFTHETWQSISRQREEFPDDLQMVGWYHTHPDWGVFLSGMDMFICDNFFNKDLDLALVIDPCRDDRGWFIWTNAAGSERVKRTGGFYLFGSRFRESEIQYFAELFGGEFSMPNQRYSPIAGQVGPHSAPVVHLHDSRDSQSSRFLIAMVMMQFLFLAMIGWKVLLPNNSAQENAKQSAAHVATENEVLNRLVAKLDPKARKSLIADLEKAKTVALQSEVSVEAHQALNANLVKDIGVLNEKLLKKTKFADEQKEKVAKLQAINLKQESELKSFKEDTPMPINWMDWRVIVAGVLVAIISSLAGFLSTLAFRSQDDDFDDDDEDEIEEPTPPKPESQNKTNDKSEGINFDTQ